MRTLLESISKTQRISESILNKSKTKQASTKDYEYYKSLGTFNSYQLYAINDCFKLKLTPEQIEFIANPEYHSSLMQHLKGCFSEGHTIDEIEHYFDLKKYDYDQIHQIIQGIANGLDQKQLKILSNPKFDSWQMRNIRNGLEHGLTKDRLKIHIDGPTKAQLKLMSSRRFNDDQKLEIRRGFEDGLTMDEVKTYANPRIDADEMYNLRYLLKRDIPGYKQ